MGVVPNRPAAFFIIERNSISAGYERISARHLAPYVDFTSFLPTLCLSMYLLHANNELYVERC